MTIGSDISEVFEDVGSPCQIIKSDGSTIDSYFDPEPHSQSSTIFVRQNCIDGVFPYDLDIEQGDIVLYNGVYTLVMNLKPELFQGDVVVQSAYLIQCNTSTGAIYRKQTIRTDYKASNSWGTPIFENLVALHYAGNDDTTRELIKDAAFIEQEEDALYLSAYIDVHVGDRWKRSPTAKPYQIFAITDRKFEGLHKCTIFEDDRA